MTRDRSASGITAAKIAPMLISSIITPNPLANSAVNNSSRTSGERASGTSISGAVKTRQPATYAQPMPIRAAIRLVTSAPITPPMAPPPRTSPSTPGRTCSTRIA